jgi:hypothetical protein
MSEHPFQSWLDSAANYPSVLGCGVSGGNVVPAVKTFSESLSEQQIKDLLQRLAEIALSLRVYQLTGTRLRWAFEHGEFHVARRMDGVMAVLAVMQIPQAPAAARDLLAKFDTLQGPAAPAEKSTLRGQ